MPRKGLLLFAFFLTGFSSLVYEVLWSRQLSLVFGSTIYAISVTLAAFMAGLAVGSFYFGKICDRAKDPILLYAVIQIITGLSSILVTLIIPRLNSIYPALLNYSYPPFSLISLLSFIFSFTLILVPTFLIGGSFPLMAKIYINNQNETGFGLGALYGVNTFGSVIGAILVSFFLIGNFGINGTAFMAAAINILIGVLLLLTKKLLSLELSPTAAETKDDRHRKTIFQPLIVAIGLSGFASLGYEVIWTRIFAMFLQNTVYSFTIILASFLSGIVIGSFLYAKILSQKTDQLFVFALLEAILGLYVIMLNFIFPELPRIMLMIAGGADLSWSSTIILQFVVIFLLVIPATIVMGIIFPMVIRISTRNLEVLGHEAGVVYGANTIGALIGSLATGFILIPLLGTQPGLRVLAFLNIFIGFAILVLLVKPVKMKSTVSILSILVLAIFFSLFKTNVILPPSVQLGLGSKFSLLYYRETPSGTVTVTEEKATGIRSCYVNNSAVCGTTYDALKTVRTWVLYPYSFTLTLKKSSSSGSGSA